MGLVIKASAPAFFDFSLSSFEVYADEGEPVRPVERFDDLAGHPGDDPVHSRGIHQTELPEGPLCFAHLSP